MNGLLRFVAIGPTAHTDRAITFHRTFPPT
jgi:hypothetical protein